MKRFRLRMKSVHFVLSVYFLLEGCGSHHPFDATLRSTVIRNERAFTKLVQMTHEDSQLTRIAPTFTWPDHHNFSYNFDFNCSGLGERSILSH
jgi:hypothetical protein